MIVTPWAAFADETDEDDRSAYFVFWHELLGAPTKYLELRLHVENAQCSGTSSNGFTCLSPDKAIVIEAPALDLREDEARLETECRSTEMASNNAKCVTAVEFRFSKPPALDSERNQLLIYADNLDLLNE